MKIDSIKAVLAISALLALPALASEEVTLTCGLDPNIDYSDQPRTDKNDRYTIWLSADRKLAKVSSLTMGVHEFEIRESGEDSYIDTLSTIEAGKPDLEFYLQRNDLGVLYNRGYASGKRVFFLGKCEIKPRPKI
jgi:hypothetical protein